MKRPTLNLVIELFGWFSFSTMIATGLLLEFVLPRRSGRLGLSFLGYRRHDWSEFHAYLSVGFLIAMLVHVLLHWNWIVMMCWGSHDKPQPWPRRIGVLSVVLLSMLVMLSPWLLQ